MKHKPRPVIPEEHRLAMVAALKPVDHAVLGDKTDMFRPIEEIRPEIITIGFNQMFSETQLEEQLRARNLSPRIVRIGRYADGELCSSRLVVKRIIDKRCTRPAPPGINPANLYLVHTHPMAHCGAYGSRSSGRD